MSVHQDSYTFTIIKPELISLRDIFARFKRFALWAWSQLKMRRVVWPSFFSRWKVRVSRLTMAQRVSRASLSGTRSHWTLPNKSGGTAGCQHSYGPSPPVAHPFGLQFAQFIAPVYLTQSAISARRQREATPMEKRRSARFAALGMISVLNAKRWEKTWKSWRCLWSNCTSPRLHLFSRRGEKKKRRVRARPTRSEPAVWLGLFLLWLPAPGEYFYMAHANIRADTWYPSAHRSSTFAQLSVLHTHFIQYRIVFSYHCCGTHPNMFGISEALGSPRILSRSAAVPGRSGLRHIIRNGTCSPRGTRASSRLSCGFIFLLLILTPRVDSSWWWVQSSISARHRWRTLARRHGAF